MDYIEEMGLASRFRQDVLEALRHNLNINHGFFLDSRGQKYLTISIDFAGNTVTETSILVGQYKDLHDYSKDCTQQIL